MAKYRLLTMSELEELKTEFVEYLVLNGIDKDSWVKIKSEDSDKAQQIIDLFSDVVFENILRKTKYLKHVSPRSIKVFECGEETITLVGLDSDDPSIDLSKEEAWDHIKQSSQNLSVYTQTKPYQSSGREQELYGMMQRGCVKVDEAIYQWLKQLL